MKNSFSFSLAAVLALALILGGCTGESLGRSASSPSPNVLAPASPLPFSTLKLKPVQLGSTVSYAGTVKARRQAILSTRLSGRITFLEAEEGDVLEKGALAARIDAADIEARTRQAQAGQQAAVAALGQSAAGKLQAQQAVAQAQAQFMALSDQKGEAQARLSVAQKDYERYSTLATQGAIPRQEADHAQAELKAARSRQDSLQSQIKAASAAIAQAQAAVESARSAEVVASAQIELAAAGVAASATDLDYAQVYAPFRGVVVEKMAYQNELSTPGRPLLKLQDLNSLEVALMVPEAALEEVRAVEVFSALVPGIKKDLKLRLREVVAAANPNSRTVEVRLKLLEVPPDLFPGSYVKVAIPERPRRQILVPESAVVSRGQLEGVFVLGRDNIAQFRLLQFSAAKNGEREVLSGLDGSETIVLEPSEELSDGRQVRPK